MKIYKAQVIYLRRKSRDLLINVIRFLEIKGLIKFNMMFIIILYRLLICKFGKKIMKRQNKFIL